MAIILQKNLNQNWTGIQMRISGLIIRKITRSFCRSPADNSPKQLLELEKSLEEISQLTKNDPSATVIVGGDL